MSIMGWGNLGIGDPGDSGPLPHRLTDCPSDGPGKLFNIRADRSTDGPSKQIIRLGFSPHYGNPLTRTEPGFHYIARARLIFTVAATCSARFRASCTVVVQSVLMMGL
jgi:hypothetical protein